MLPFGNLSGDAEQAYFAEGIAEDIVTALSRMHWLFVISSSTSMSFAARNADARAVSEELGVRYILKGSVRRSTERLRVTVQLVDAPQDRVVWANRYDGLLENVFDFQDEVTARVASILEPEITRAELENTRQKRPENLDAWEHYLRALPLMNRLERASNQAARETLSRAIEIDPDFVLPHVALSWCWAMAAFHAWHFSGHQALELTRRHARRALELDPGDARAQCAVAVAAFWSGRQADGIARARQALELDPNMVDAHGILGATLAVAGEPEAAINCLERALQGSPKDPTRWFWHHSQANARFALGDYEAARHSAGTALDLRPGFADSRLIAAASAALSGEADAARGEIARLLSEIPEYSVDRVLKNPMWADDESFTRLIDGLRRAGLPETG